MTTSPQAISRILNAAGITKSQLRRGRICMMASEGYEVTKDFYNNITVDYRKRTSSITSDETWVEIKNAQMAKINEILIAKGYKVSQATYGFLVTKEAN
jgi:translation initiation factor 1 (eIF-1/SUI1)